MKKHLRLWMAILFIALLALPALPGQRQKMLSSTKSFIIDGKRYLLEKSAGDDISLLRRELALRGWNIPIAGVTHPINPLFVDALKEDGGTTSTVPIPFPHDMKAEHTLRLESESGPVDLAYGSISSRGPQMRRRLSASGWKCIETGHGQDQTAVATLKRGRETTIVFLEEKEGEFLLVRKPE